MKPMTLFALLLAATLAVVSSKSYKSFKLEAEMPYVASDFTATSFFTGDHKIVLFGGCSGEQVCTNSGCSCTAITNKCTEYDPATDVYTALATAPVARYRHMATAVGKFLYIIGGRSLADDLIKPIHKYDTEANTWSVALADFADATSDGGAFTHDSDIYVVSGYDQAYSTSASVLSKIDSDTMTVTTLAPMPTARGDFAIVGLGGLFYVIGGWKLDDYCVPSRLVDAYNPATNTWSTKTPLILGRADFVAGLMGGHIFAIGGETKNVACDISLPIDDVERYDPDAESWFVEEDIYLPLFRFVGATDNTSHITENGIFLFGGQGIHNGDSHPIVKTALKYTPSSASSFTPVAALMVALATLAMGLF